MAFLNFDCMNKILQDASRIVKRLTSLEQEGELGIDCPTPQSLFLNCSLLNKWQVKMFCQKFSGERCSVQL